MGIENGTHIGDFVVLIISPQIGPVKIYAQNYLQAPAE
jgi:hypothetical protein